MKIKLDENLPASLAGTLARSGHDVDTVPQEGLSGQTDEQIWRATQKAERFLITQDLDFSDINRYQPGTHHGILLVRLPDPSRTKLTARLQKLFEDEDIESWKEAFVVATERKVRVRRPNR